MKQKILGALLALAVPCAPAAAQGNAGKHSVSPSAFSLTPTPSTWTKASELQCSIFSVGRFCDSHIMGFWPAGTPNAHVFEFGPQITAVIPRAPGCTDALRETARTPDCFPWAGDTTGMIASDASARRHILAVDGVHDSRPLNDDYDWPLTAGIPGFPFASALISDTAVFSPSLFGKQHIAEHDTWTAYRDNLGLAGRTSPLGILVEQRTLTWSYPEGNEATIYIVYRISNITHTAAFQAAAEAALFAGVDRLPDQGWSLDSIHFSLYADFDIGLNYSLNHLTASLPFDMIIGYQAPFTDPLFVYPAQHFHPPFFAHATSLIGLHVLKAPGGRGLTAINSYTGGGAFPLPTTLQRAWGVASHNGDPAKGDPVCALPGMDSRQSGFCWLGQTTSDVRGTLATGPFSLAPGQSETIIVALTAAATVATPRIAVGNAAANAPGWPTLAPGCGAEPVRPIEEGAGWVETLACPEAGRVDPMQVRTAPKSLFGRARIARAVVANRFMMPAAPAAPEFQLVAARDSIVVRWQPSVTETEGDPYFAIASDAANPLYDPSYRRNDVQGYRVWRGMRPDSLHTIAQFDHAGTGVPFEFVDATVVPGMTYHYSVTAFDSNSTRSAPASMESARIVRTARATIAGNPLRSIHTVPDPYYGSSGFDLSGLHRQLRFVNMPPRATLRIYTLSGVLVDVIDHDDPAGVGHAEWDLRGRGNHPVRSGVYFFHVSTPDGRERIGRFTVVMPNGS